MVIRITQDPCNRVPPFHHYDAACIIAVSADRWCGPELYRRNCSRVTALRMMVRLVCRRLQISFDCAVGSKVNSRTRHGATVIPAGQPACGTALFFRKERSGLIATPMVPRGVRLKWRYEKCQSRLNWTGRAKARCRGRSINLFGTASCEICSGRDFNCRHPGTATALQVSRNTVMLAYEWLTSGVYRNEEGAGTFVCRVISDTVDDGSNLHVQTEPAPPTKYSA